mmetsp:Transcript_2827/g.4034  ORF Transcript_2827/g.4034 Transcript_2827/m.4034 type:complete len:642 (+) Transcript_2827:49-1974(+)|eukprot:CAMPEP_0117023908 /NCGR_PEP_ID=MMETSP0472-20121206/17801_1 /TAXON_ID=693140 ORGANISM="Tiarina fusus, Strain LIS" /NCGR_SAMPLE_ID=MMETSP0472 /ASSEMBLY_ACC=CAM_ASM_000603 /LENGTH=641 /DNA_ID=CAMNT_0004730173 /DNA_START=47 /DNA_END=1972 /DNA_ORIENTATION=-
MWIYVLAFLITAIVAWKILFGSNGEKKPAFSPAEIKFDPAPKIGLSAIKKEVKVKKPGQIGVKVVFGSQTGTAEDFAQTIAEEAASYDFFSEVVDIETLEMDDLAEEEFVIFMLATYGEGEPTDNAKEFYDALMDENCQEFPSLKYTIFGLGNKTYEFYNAVARRFDERLTQLGAESVFPLGEGDDDCSLQEDFDNWRRKLWEPICSKFGVEFKSVAQVIKPTYILKKHDASVKQSTLVTWNTKGINRNVVDVKHPVMCKVLVNRELHSPGSDRSCLHLEIELQEKMKYTAGDHVGIYPENNIADVREWLDYFELDENEIISVVSEDAPSRPLVGPCSTFRLLSNFVDLYAIPKKKLLQALAIYTDDEEEKKRLELLGSSDDNGWAEYNDYIKNCQRTVMELLKDFPSCKPSFIHVVELIPPTKPRYYSISSSPKQHPNSVHVTAVVLEYKTGTGRTHKGVCTNWMSEKQISDIAVHNLPCFIRASSFRLPKDPKTPIIMIGPGTGIAPFRGFIQDRKHTEGSGDSILFFGCRSKDIDFLYADELNEHLADGSLGKLITAFSREQDEKVYVQHRLLEMKHEIWPLLQDAYIYVCGDSKYMAKDVHKALRVVVMEAGGKTQKEAEQFITALQTKNRYQQDVW